MLDGLAELHGGASVHGLSLCLLLGGWEARGQLLGERGGVRHEESVSWVRSILFKCNTVVLKIIGRLLLRPLLLSRLLLLIHLLKL